MPYDTGTAQLLNQLTNPPNPMDYLQKASNALTSMREFQAKQAIANAYQQATDPATGQVDQGKLNALTSQGPGAFLQGQAMEQGGRGVQAQALGTSADLEARQNQLAVAGNYLAPLYQKAMSGETITAGQVNAMLDNIPPGVLPGSMINNMRTKVNALGPSGDATGVVLGAAFANTHAMEVLKQMGPQPTVIGTGGAQQIVPMGPMWRGGAAAGRTLPMTLSPEGQTDIVTIYDSDNVPHQMARPDATRAVGGQVPGAAPGVVYTPNMTPAGPVPNAVPPSTAPAGPAAGGATRPLPPLGPSQFPSGAAPPPAPPAAAPVPPIPPASSAAPNQPPPGQKTPTGATFGTGPQPGQVETMKASTDAYNALRNDMDASNPNGSQQRIFNLQQAQAALAQAKTGPGTQTVSDVAGVIGSWAPDFVKNVTGLDVKDLATNRDIAAKYLTRLAGAQAQNIGGGVTNDKLAAGVAGSPNIHIQDLAANDILKVMTAQEQMRQYLWNQAQAQGVQPKDFANWSAKWATSHDPRAFVVNTLPPAQHKALIDSLIKNGKATPEGVTLANTVSELRKNGAMPGEGPAQAPE
jgi:hypothetical protein